MGSLVMSVDIKTINANTRRTKQLAKILAKSGVHHHKLFSFFFHYFVELSRHTECIRNSINSD